MSGGGKQAIEGRRANGRSQGTKKEGRRQVADDHGASSRRQFLRCLQAKLREVFILNRFARAKANQLSDRLRVGPGAGFACASMARRTIFRWLRCSRSRIAVAILLLMTLNC